MVWSRCGRALKRGSSAGSDRKAWRWYWDETRRMSNEGLVTMRALILCLSLVTACKGFIDSAVPPPPPPGVPALQRVGNFSSPVYLTAPPADTQRLFVIQQDGAVRVLHHDTIQTRPFLDLRGQIAFGGEQGLLSLAFDPLYATNGRFFVYFTNPNGDIRIVRYNVSSDRDSADEATADTVLRVAHPVQSNHNGGQLQFGPDNMLWAGTGAGGGRGVNFGWNIMEGLHCYPSDPCTPVGQLPVVEYAHFGGACSITGGYVYRGSALPELAGNYFYADYCDGSVHSIKYPTTNPGDWSTLLSPGGSISAFGQDARGELYILQLTGPVWRIVPAP